MVFTPEFRQAHYERLWAAMEAERRQAKRLRALAVGAVICLLILVLM